MGNYYGVQYTLGVHYSFIQAFTSSVPWCCVLLGYWSATVHVLYSLPETPRVAELAANWTSPGAVSGPTLVAYGSEQVTIQFTDQLDELCQRQ